MLQIDSCDCTKTELDLKSIPPTMATMQGTEWVGCHHAPIEFTIPPHTDVYTDLSQIYLYVKFRILKGNGDDLAADSKVYSVNNLFTVCSVVLICT